MISCIADSAKSNIAHEDSIATKLVEDEGESYVIRIADQVHLLNDKWNQLSEKELLHSDYLGAVERGAPIDMDFTYTYIEKDGHLIGKAYYQILHFNASKSLSSDSPPASKQSFFKTLRSELKNVLTRSIDFYTLVNGNLLLTGDYSFEFSPEINKVDRLRLLQEMNGSVKAFLESKYPKEISVFLMKECYPDCRLPKSYTENISLYEFCIQQNFVLDIPLEWTDYSDYLQALKGKYRVRAKRARKKAASVNTRMLEADQVEQHQSKLHELYQNIANQIGFNMVNLNPSYFSEVKNALGNNFQVVVFEKESEILGFYSYFLLKDEVVAHYVGFDPEYSYTHQLYLNMLLDFIDISINHGKRRINLGRTANEIKSSVGAIPVDMYCYIQHKNKVYHSFVPKLLDYLSPKETWEPRHPFKDNE